MMSELRMSSYLLASAKEQRLCGTIEGEFGGKFSQLPEGIIFDILSRLQLRDLRECRYVRKSWYKTITSPYFSKLHHEKSASRGTYLVSYILLELNDSDPCFPYDLYLLESYLSESGRCALEILHLKTEFKDMGVEYGIVGSCNGLLCLFEPFLADPVYICNPLIGEYITLPLSNDLTDECIISGFGFDQTTGEYKVIRMTCHRVVLIDGEIRRDLEAEVYTLGSKNWRKIGVVPFLPRRGDKPGVFFNGVIHWMSESWDIVCFDIASENFSVVKGPPLYYNVETDIGSTSDDFLDVRVIKGHLCLLGYTINRLVVWVMNKYGDDQSWIKKLFCDNFKLEKHVVSGILKSFPLAHDLCPHVGSLVSHIRPMEESSGGEEGGSLKLEDWTRTLNPIAPGPRPNGRAIAFEEEYQVPEEVEEVEVVEVVGEGGPDEDAVCSNILRLFNLGIGGQSQEWVFVETEN